MDSLRSLLCYPWCLETMTEKQQTAFVLDTYWGWDVFQYALQQLCQSWYNLNHQRWWKNLWEKQMNTARKLVCVVCKCPLLWTFQYLLISGMMLLAHSPPPTGKSTLKANFISCVYLIFQNNPLEVLSRGNKANSAADIQLVTYLDLLIKGFEMNPFFFSPLYWENCFKFHARLLLCKPGYRRKGEWSFKMIKWLVTQTTGFYPYVLEKMLQEPNR